MPPKITVSIRKGGVPPGKVLLEDDSSISSGLHDSLARLIQRQLGFPWRVKLRGEAKRLTRVALTGVSEGSSVLHYEGLQPPGITGRYPSAIAAFDLVSGIGAYSDSHAWPAYLPPIVRNRLGAAVAPILRDKNESISIEVEEDGRRANCVIGSSTTAALQEPEEFTTEVLVNVVGKIIDLNIEDPHIKIQAAGRTVTVQVDEQQFLRADSDELRWGRVYVSGFPQNEQCKTVHKVEELRLAADDEEDGVSQSSELRRGEKAEAYRLTLERSLTILQLPDDWNTYGAKSPSKRANAFALHFLRDAIGVFLDHAIEVPAPFLVPTPSGGVQYEWQVDNRELELEIPEKGKFQYLKSDGRTDSEGEASRWTAMRLLRWVVTGEEV